MKKFKVTITKNGIKIYDYTIQEKTKKEAWKIAEELFRHGLIKYVEHGLNKSFQQKIEKIELIKED